MKHAISDQQAAHSDDMIAASQAITLWGLFRERVRRCPDAIAYRDYDHMKRVWRDHYTSIYAVGNGRSWVAMW